MIAGVAGFSIFGTLLCGCHLFLRHTPPGRIFFSACERLLDREWGAC